MKALAFKVRDGIKHADVEDVTEVMILVAISATTFLALAPLVQQVYELGGVQTPPIITKDYVFIYAQ